MRVFKSVILIVLLSQNSPLKADELNICAVVDGPSKFNHQFIAVEGMASKVDKSSSRSGSKETTFVLRNLSGCEVLVYFPGSSTLNKGDHVEVEGKFETERVRENSVFYNEVQARKITTLSR
jgi:hypothetical protein